MHTRTHPLVSRRRLLAVTLGASAALLGGHAMAKPPEQELAKAQATTPTPTRLWIDVRTPGEYAQGHLPGAINIPLDSIAQRIASHAPDKNAPIALYCRSGNRSEHARQILQSLGYTQVSNEGGYADLMRRGVKAQ